MRFAAIATIVGLAGTLLASNLQGAVIAGEGISATVLATDDIITGSNVVDQQPTRQAPDAVRLIDLRSGATCKVAKPNPSAHDFSRVPFGPDCAKSPGLSQIAYWRSTDEGGLIMADRDHGTVLEFAPGDGVLFESVYPENELITIVPAKN